MAYGGARGGGKSWAIRTKSLLLALHYNGIRVLIVRRSYAELRENHIVELTKMLNGIATYSETTKTFTFGNGSTIKFGYCDGERDVLRYQGMEFDVIFIDEATQLSEFQFEALNASIRGVNDFPKRMYLTCNPGGVGHAWVKRLFIEKKYREGENSKDFKFIAASIFDNTALLEKDGDYLHTLEKLPTQIKRAWLYGDWDILSGQYFPEFDPEIHTCAPFEIPDDWRIYSTMDYGLDMLAHYYIAIDMSGNVFVVDEIYEKNQIISSASEKILSSKYVDAYTRIAPPDLWGRSQESGKSRVDIFAENGVYLTKCSNDIEAGLLAVKELLKVTDGKANFKIFNNCSNLIYSLTNILSDTLNPNITANNPHELT
ncbi:MAG: phage terminase large subunit, partial [Clostridia bacterium]